MKTKKLLSVILAIIVTFAIILCSFTTVFATDDILKNGDYERIYCGEISYGWTEVCERPTFSTEDLYIYYTFNATEDGYYLFGYGTPHTDMWAGILDTTTGTEPDYEETIYDYYYVVDKIYYLEKGSYNFVIDIYSTAEDVNIQSEFLGKDITGISFDYEQLLDYDLYWYGSEGSYSFDSYADATITFSSGKIYEFNDGVLEGTVDSEPVEGKNNVKVNFLDKEIPTSVTVYPVSHFIMDVELSNVEYYLKNTVEYYNHLEKEYPYGETITVTFTNGTKQTVEYKTSQEWVTLPNGQGYEIYVGYDTDYNFLVKNTYQLVICLGFNCIIKTYDVNGSKAAFIENIKALHEDNKVPLNEIYENMKLMFKSAGSEEDLMWCFENMIFGLLEIYINCYDFFHYYISFSFI